MPTIINNPSTDNGNSGGAGVIIGIVLTIAILAIFFLYGLPSLRKNNTSGTTVNVPDKVQIDVNK